MPLPTIPSGNVASALPTGYDVANSCMFDKGDAPELSRSTGDGNERIGNFSFWWKTAMPHDGFVFYNVYIDSSNFFAIGMDGGGNIEVVNKSGGSYNMQLETTAAYRDHTAWYHVCALIDTTQATDTNRMKLYINGTQVTSFQTSTYPAQDTDLKMNSNSQTARISPSQNRGHGYLAEFVAIDGTVKAVTDFGEFDEDSPTIWKPKDVAGLSGDKGVNGFYLDFEDSSALGNCAFGGTDFTVSNLAAIDQMIDSPTNNFCTLNPLNNMASAHMVITDGNLHKHNQPTNNYWRSIYATMGASSGKWYYEMLVTNDEGSDVGNMFIGIVDADQMDNHLTASAHYKFVTRSRGYGYFGQNGNKDNNASSSSFGNTWGNGDRLGCAFDLDNNKIYFSKNGTWENSGDPTSGATGTGSAFDLASGYTYLPVIGVHYGNSQMDLNFGSPMAAISSGNADGDGYGNFEYAVPSGYYALCTKNLAEYG